MIPLSQLDVPSHQLLGSHFLGLLGWVVYSRGPLDDVKRSCDPPPPPAQDHWLPKAQVIPLHLMISCGSMGAKEVGCSLGLKNGVNEMNKDTEAGHSKIQLIMCSVNAEH